MDAGFYFIRWWCRRGLDRVFRGAVLELSLYNSEHSTVTSTVVAIVVGCATAKLSGSFLHTRSRLFYATIQSFAVDFVYAVQLMLYVYYEFFQQRVLVYCSLSLTFVIYCFVTSQYCTGFAVLKLDVSCVEKVKIFRFENLWIFLWSPLLSAQHFFVMCRLCTGCVPCTPAVVFLIQFNSIRQCHREVAVYNPFEIVGMWCTVPCAGCGWNRFCTRGVRIVLFKAFLTFRGLFLSVWRCRMVTLRSFRTFARSGWLLNIDIADIRT